MKFRIKAALFMLSAGMIALSSGSCFFRWLGKAVGDNVIFQQHWFNVK